MSGFELSGGDRGALLIHGFTGTPEEMRFLGHALHDRGLTVHAENTVLAVARKLVDALGLEQKRNAVRIQWSVFDASGASAE